MIKKVQLALSFWVVLLLAILPISYRFLPEIGKLLSTLLLPLNEWMCAVLFNISIEKTYLISDSAAYYSGAILMLILSIIVVLSTSSLNINFTKVRQFLFLLLCYALAYFLLRYGFDKILGNQFYFPAANTLHTPIGSASKDLLYWSTMGTSAFYTYFMAITEIVAGSLLLWKRTRFLGLFVSFGVLSNVFATNIGFDITVKYFSGLLLVTTLICLTYFLPELKRLVGIQSESNESVIVVANRSKKCILKSLVLLVLFTEIAIPYIQKGDYPFQSQSYLVTETIDSGEIPLFTDAKRIHIHRGGYLVIESHDQEFKSYPIQPSQNGFRYNKLNFAINRDGSRLSWLEDGSLKELFVERIDLGELELSKDESHWCVEEIIK